MSPLLIHIYHNLSLIHESFNLIISFFPFSFADLVNSPTSSRQNLGPSFSQQAFFSTSRDSLSLAGACGTTSQRPTLNPHVSAAKSEMDLTNRKNRKKERGRLKASGEQPLLGSWSRSGTRESNANTIDTATSTHHLAAPTTSGNNNNSNNNNGNSSTNNDCNGAER